MVEKYTASPGMRGKTTYRERRGGYGQPEGTGEQPAGDISQAGIGKAGIGKAGSDNDNA